MSLTPHTVFAPYRICPLGAHIDHQGGPVLGMAINVGTELSFVPRQDDGVELTSANYPARAAFSLAAPPPPEPGAWRNYAAGAVVALREQYPLTRGLTGTLRGALPGGGLSSSASVILAYLHALAHVNELTLDAWDYVRLVQRVENGYLGLRNGILDQASIVFGREDALLHIDTVARRVTALRGPAPAAYEWLVAFSGQTRALVSSNYNNRVRECGDAARLLSQHAGQPAAQILSDVPTSVFQQHGAKLPDAVRRRAQHYFDETARVRQGIAAWQAGDVAQFGRFMTASCESSIANYECGSVPVHTLQRIVTATPGCHGARFSGGGFGGCVVALFAPGAAPAACRHILDEYGRAMPELRAAARVLRVHGAPGVQSR